MFLWDDYFSLAEELFDGHARVGISQEARLRNSVSRAYYGAYCQARNFCDRKRIYKPSGGAEDHQNLIDSCQRHFEPDVKRIGTKLSWLRDRRNRCDYVNDLNADPIVRGAIYRTADEAIDRAKDIFDAVRNLENKI